MNSLSPSAAFLFAVCFSNMLNIHVKSRCTVSTRRLTHPFLLTQTEDRMMERREEERRVQETKASEPSL